MGDKKKKILLQNTHNGSREGLTLVWTAQEDVMF